MRSQFSSCQRLGGLGRCPGVRVMYGSFGGATVHGDAAYSAQMCSLLYYRHLNLTRIPSGCWTLVLQVHTSQIHSYQSRWYLDVIIDWRLYWRSLRTQATFHPVMIAPQHRARGMALQSTPSRCSPQR